MTCVCCRDEDRQTTPVRGVELCDECAEFMLQRLASALEMRARLAGWDRSRQMIDAALDGCALADEVRMEHAADGNCSWPVNVATTIKRLREAALASSTSPRDEGLKAYVQHHSDCRKNIFPACDEDHVCTCGLDALLTASSPGGEKP